MTLAPCALCAGSLRVPVQDGSGRTVACPFHSGATLVQLDSQLRPVFADLALQHQLEPAGWSAPVSVIRADWPTPPARPRPRGVWVLEVLAVLGIAALVVMYLNGALS